MSACARTGSRSSTRRDRHANPTTRPRELLRVDDPRLPRRDDRRRTPKPEDFDGPRSYFEFLATVRPEPDGEHGEVFGYKTANADAFGWLVARTTGKSVAENLAERVWARIGAERAGFYTVDSIGTPFAAGGTRLRRDELQRCLHAGSAPLKPRDDGRREHQAHVHARSRSARGRAAPPARRTGCARSRATHAARPPHAPPRATAEKGNFCTPRALGVT